MAFPLFAVLTIRAEHTETGFMIIITTNVPCHLWMRWTLIPTRIHLEPRYKRGFPSFVEPRYCVDVYEDNEQMEDGDTLEHTFDKPNWPFCTTRYFYFWGTVAGVFSPSESPIFSKHRIKPTGSFILRPNAPGDLTENKQYPDEGFNWEKVKEVVLDELDTYVWSDVRHTYQRDLYNIEAAPAPYGIISKVSFFYAFYVSSDPWQNAVVIGYLKTQDRMRSMSLWPWIWDTWQSTTVDYDKNPVSELPWTWDDIENLQIGFGARQGWFPPHYTFASQCYVTIHRA